MKHYFYSIEDSFSNNHTGVCQGEWIKEAMQDAIIDAGLEDDGSTENIAQVIFIAPYDKDGRVFKFVLESKWVEE